MTDNIETAQTNEQPSPNDNWKEDTRLDDNGNVLEQEAPVVEEPTKEEEAPVSESEPSKEEEKEETTEEPAKLDETDAPTPPKEFDSNAAGKVQPFLEDAGLVPSEVAKSVTDNGGEVTPEIMKALVEKHGEGVAALLKDKLTYLHESNVAASQKADNAIYAHVETAFKDTTEQSGADSFKELASWAKDNLSKEERTEINGLLSQGGKAAELAVNSLVDTFKKSDSFMSTPAKLLQADDTSTEYGGKPLDKAGYDRELRKLMDTGHDYNTSPEIAQLNKRRTKSLARGY